MVTVVVVKTFLYNLMSLKVRSKGKIVLDVTSSRIASLLLQNNKIVHSKFKIFLIVDEYSMYNT
ncbi:hypothetical protein AHAS_Ahas13G0226000 [Arachis hypogaea]